MNCLQPLPSPVIIRQLSDLDFKSPSLIMTLVPQIFNDFLLYIHTHTHTISIRYIVTWQQCFYPYFPLAPPYIVTLQLDILLVFLILLGFFLPCSQWLLFYFIFFLPGMFSLFLRLCLVDILGVIQVLCQKSPTQFSAWISFLSIPKYP